MGVVGRFLTFIRFSHTVFALPYALGALFVAADGLPSVRVLVLVVLAMVFARTSAMIFNRIADWEIDKRNPRTQGRHKLVSKQAAVVVLILNCLAFLAVCYGINRLSFVLAPVALAVVFFYSVTKRFTFYTQFFLGLSLSVAPVGAWIAVRGEFGLPALILAAGVLVWVAGFDIIYATQDLEFDRNEGLKSLVVRYGIAKSLGLAQWLHGLMFLFLVGFGFFAGLGWLYAAGMLLILGALVYEHFAAARLDTKSLNDAFFKSNAFVSFVFLAAVAGELALRRWGAL